MFLPFLTLLVDAWFAALCFPQVIYKKFQICCPLEEYSANGTASHLSYNLSSHDHDHGHGQEDDSHCSTYMFTMNSQVGGRQRGDPVRLLVLVSCPDTRHSVPASDLLCQSHTFVFLADGVHHSHSRFRLRLSPGGPPHLHGAPQVSQPLSACDVCQRIAAECGSCATF